MAGRRRLRNKSGNPGARRPDRCHYEVMAMPTGMGALVDSVPRAPTGPPPRPSWWSRLTVGLSAAAALSVIACWIYAMATLTRHDDPELIDDPSVISKVESACAEMTASLAQPVASGSIRAVSQASTIRAQNEAVEAMTSAIRSLGRSSLAQDRPTAEWLTNWDELVRVRTNYADDLAASRSTTYIVPRIEGVPVTFRINEVSVACEVPPQLAGTP